MMPVGVWLRAKLPVATREWPLQAVLIGVGVWHPSEKGGGCFPPGAFSGLFGANLPVKCERCPEIWDITRTPRRKIQNYCDI